MCQSDSVAMTCLAEIEAFGWHIDGVQAHTARRAQQSANEQAHEQHVAEQTRQREHEQMMEQISRINRCDSQPCRIRALD
eukprot:SAG31_NODE_975_length_10623_cov_7.244964_8_plen_80_part_00